MIMIAVMVIVTVTEEMMMTEFACNMDDEMKRMYVVMALMIVILTVVGLMVVTESVALVMQDCFEV